MKTAATLAVVVVVAVAGELHHASVASADAALRQQSAALRQSSGNVDLVGIAARFALLQQYDGLVDAETALRAEIAALAAQGLPDDVAEALKVFQKVFERRQAELLLLKAHRGVLTNTERYLPRLLDDLRKQSPDDPRVDEARALVLAWQLARDDDDASLHGLQEFGARLKGSAAAVAAVVPHLEALVAMRRALVAVTREQLLQAPLAAAADEVIQSVDVVAAAHAGEARLARAGVLGLALLLTLTMLWRPERS
ncbi:MAG: hypothetical protein Q8O67_10570 [Deltaproteobacteria bacterium]|nr:hypothetical protein [Deltaproteobacteria bacterium]